MPLSSKKRTHIRQESSKPLVTSSKKDKNKNKNKKQEKKTHRSSSESHGRHTRSRLIMSTNDTYDDDTPSASIEYADDDSYDNGAVMPIFIDYDVGNRVVVNTQTGAPSQLGIVRRIDMVRREVMVHLVDVDATSSFPVEHVHKVIHHRSVDDIRQNRWQATQDETKTWWDDGDSLSSSAHASPSLHVDAASSSLKKMSAQQLRAAAIKEGLTVRHQGNKRYKSAAQLRTALETHFLSRDSQQIQSKCSEVLNEPLKCEMRQQQCMADVKFYHLDKDARRTACAEEQATCQQAESYRKDILQHNLPAMDRDRRCLLGQSGDDADHCGKRSKNKIVELTGESKTKCHQFKMIKEQLQSGAVRRLSLDAAKQSSKKKKH